MKKLYTAALKCTNFSCAYTFVIVKNIENPHNVERALNKNFMS